MIWQRQTFAVIPHPVSGVRWLCVKYESTLTDKPQVIAHYWPISPIDGTALAAPYGALKGIEGAEAHASTGSSNYQWRRAPYDWMNFELINGPQTKPIRTETTELQPPKSRVPVRWYFGQWQKCTKAEGWVNIGVNA